MLGEVRAGPSKGKGLGLADDILGKKSSTSLSSTSPSLSMKQSTASLSLKPLGDLGEAKGNQRPLSLAKTQPIPKKIVRMADPLESSQDIGEVVREVPKKPVETLEKIENQNNLSPNPVRIEDHDDSEKEEIPSEKEIAVSPPTQDIENPVAAAAIDGGKEILLEGSHIQVEQNQSLQRNETVNHESNPIPTSTTPLEDLTELATLRGREALITQQYATLSIQRLYSQLVDRASVQYPLHVAILKGDDKQVEQMLTLGENGTILIENLNQLNYCDRHCRKAIHFAAYGKNPRIVDLIFLTSRLYYERTKAVELAKLKEERKKCLVDLKAVFQRENFANREPKDEIESDYRINAIEKWYMNEAARISRRIEFQVESAWLLALSDRDSRGMTPLHYCVCSPDFVKTKSASISVLEAMISPIRGGRGEFMPENERQLQKFKVRTAPSTSRNKCSLEEVVTKKLTTPTWFQPDSVYNSITGQEVITLMEQDFLSSKASPKPSTSTLSRTAKKNRLTLPDLTLGNSVSSLDRNLYEISTPVEEKLATPSVDYEIIIPWLLRNIFKRAESLGKNLGSHAIDILEELVEMIDPYSRRTLIVPEIKDLLGYLGVMVTRDVIKELCFMYPGSFEIIQEKWRMVNQDYAPVDDEDGDGEDNLTKGKGIKTKDSKSPKKGDKKTSKEGKISAKGSLKPAKGSAKSASMDIYDDVEIEISDSKTPLEKAKSARLNEEEEYGLDFNKLIDDLSTGRGMKSITSCKGIETLNMRTQREKPIDPLPSQEDDLINEFQNNVEETESVLISSHLTMDLPQTLSIRTVYKYRRYVMNLTDENRSTPVLLATALNKREVVDILLNYGSDITISSKDGHTPLTVVSDHAILSSLQKIIMKLLKSNSIHKGTISSNFSTGANMNTFSQRTVTGLGLTATESVLEAPQYDSSQLLSKSCGNLDGLLLQLHQLHTQRWNYSQTALTWAVGSGMNDMIDKLLQLGAKVTESDAMGRTPLHHCIALVGQITIDSCRDLEYSISMIFKLRSIADTLLDNGANIQARTNSGRIPLHEIFCRGQDANVSNVMKKDTKFRNEPSYLALLRAKSLIVRSLIQRGSDPHAVDRQGYCPLHYCARENMTFCMIEMLNFADINILFPCPRGRTILHIACMYGCAETAEIICKWDVDEKKSILLAKDLSGKYPRDLMAKDMDPLSLATIWTTCRSGNSLRLNEILARTQNSNAWSDVEQIQNDALTSSSLHHSMPLETRLKSQFQELWLLDGVDAKSRRKRLSPLHCAVLGWVEVSAQLGNICARRALGETKKAASKVSPKKSTNLSHATVLSILLQNFAFVDSTDFLGRTPLMFAAASNLTDCIQYLCVAGCDLNKSDNRGNTALHYAYAYGSIATISLLEEKGADSSKENLKEQTPLAIAGLFQSLESINS